MALSPEPANSFLATVPEATRASLFEQGHRRRHARGTTLFIEGDVAQEAVVVIDGLVKAGVVAADGREVILGVLGPGALIGEIASLDGGRRSATVQTLTDVEILVIPKEGFTRFLIDHPDVLHQLALVLAGRLRESDRRQLEFGTGDSLQRLCARLAELADRYGEKDADGVVQLVSPLSQSDLASWSGLSREAVVKSLRTLRDLGWIENRGRVIAILDMTKLRHRAEH